MRRALNQARVSMAATPASSTVTRQPAWIHYGLLLLAVSLVAATAFVSLNTTGELRNAIDWVSHTQTLRRFMSEAETALAEAHSDIRAYLLTGDQQWLDEHYARRERLKEITQTIAGMTVDNEDQSERAIFLIDLVSERIRVWDEAIVAYLDSGEATARATARRMGGLGLLEAIQVQISAMEQIEVQLHDARWERLQSLLEQTRSTIIIANGLALVAGALGFWLLRRSQRSWEQQRLAEMQAARAKRQSEEKSLFLANMSHEIRTPMNAIFGFTQLLGDLVQGPRERQYVQAIASSGESLLTLINDILDLSKIESGQLEINPQPSDPRALVDGVLTMFSQMAADRQLKLRADVSASLPSGLALDANRVRQVLTNLVSNAIKYTDDGSVLLRAYCDGADQEVTLHLVVEDTGIGISAEQIGKMFEPFVQGEAVQGQREGTGLGLSIARRLVDAMNGEIHVSSELGQGSVFSVSLPTRAVEVVDASTAGSVATRVELAKLPPLKILIVDDVARNRELLQAIFEGGEHTVVQAENGAEALVRATSMRPDLVLMDIRMPVLDGHSALRQMRHDPRLRQTRVIAVTASSLRMEERSLREDFDGYLRKPYTRDQLVEEVARVLEISADPSGSPLTAQTRAGDASEQTGVDSPQAEQARARLLALGGDHWQALMDSLAMREVGAFADEVAVEAKVAGIKELTSYARRLRAAVDLFDVLQAESLLSQYPQHLQSLGLRENQEAAG